MKKLIVCILVTLGALLAQRAFAVATTYTLSSGATTSAGVYDANGVLIRTLWNNVYRDAGTYSADWNGLDDDGHLRPNGTYEIRVLSNNVGYTWDGVIGNTSHTLPSTTYHHALDVITGMAISGSTIYFATGYNEQDTPAYKTTASNPQQRTRVLTKGATTLHVATDGTYVYWSAKDPWANVTFVYVTATSTDAEVILSSSGSASSNGRNYVSAINTLNGPGSTITGLAVQKNGDYLFVSRSALNRLDVLDKSTGAVVHTLTYTTPTALTVDGSDHLWMATGSGTTVAKYSVAPNGTLTSTATISTSISKALALAVSPDNAALVIADGGASQQLKWYDNLLATPLLTQGQQGGYANGPNVTNNKFYFRNNVAGSAQPDAEWTFLAFQPDGKLWVGDPGNYRSQRFAANRAFFDRIQYVPRFYSARADQNNGTRVFANFLEFAVDYSKPLGPDNGSWELVKNWGWGVPANYLDGNTILKSVTTFSNGRTYALLRNISAGRMAVVELPASGNLAFTGTETADLRYIIAKDGSLRHLAFTTCEATTPYVWGKREVTFDGSNNPQWVPLTPVISSPVRTAEDPCILGNTYSLRPWEVTSSGILLAFAEYDLFPYPGWHLQGLDISTGQWKWRSARTTHPDYVGPYPDDGAFDVGNSVDLYAGGGQHAAGRNIFWEYHGEGWKGAQTNMWTHLYDNGLMVGQFGYAPRRSGLAGVPEGTPGMAGNAFSSEIVTAQDGSLYIYQNDENAHGGLHRWHITGLDTIDEQTFSVTLANTMQAGLRGTYYDTEQVSGLEVVSTRIDPAVDFDWSTGIPGGTSLTHADSFSVRWQGFIKPRYTELYTFRTRSDDGIRLRVDGQPLIDEWFNQVETEYTGTILLEADKLYPIMLEYYDGVDGAAVSLSWSSPSQAEEIVPSSRLFFVDTSTPGSGMDIHEGLQHSSDVRDDLYGWHRDPAVDILNGDSDFWKVETSRYSYRWDLPADVHAHFSRSNKDHTVTRDLLPANAAVVTEWSLVGEIAFGGEPNRGEFAAGGGTTGNYVEVLDDAGRIIARMHPKSIPQPLPPEIVKVFGNRVNDNNNWMLSTNREAWNADYAARPVPFGISAQNGQVGFSFGTSTLGPVDVFDPAANWQKPRTLRMRFWNTGGIAYGRGVDLKGVTFSSTP